MARALNHSVVFIAGLQKRFELPVFEGAGYSAAYYALLRTIAHLLNLAIPEKSLQELWKTEKHLLQLLHFDSTGSPTWFLDECGKFGQVERRLLLTHVDLGPEFLRRMVQPQLDFAPAPRALFSSRETGDDALRIMEVYLRLYADIQTQAAAQATQLRRALRWFPRIRPPRPRSR